MRTDCVKHAFCSPDQDSPNHSTLEAQPIMNSNTLIAKHTRKARIRLDMVSHLSDKVPDKGQVGTFRNPSQIYEGAQFLLTPMWNSNKYLAET